MYVAGFRGRRFPSKKALKDHVKDGKSVDLINTSLMGDTRNYTSEDAPQGKSFAIVGPTEYERKWYASLKVVVKNGERQVKVS